jgi:hypothetical protein
LKATQAETAKQKEKKTKKKKKKNWFDWTHASVLSIGFQNELSEGTREKEIQRIMIAIG